MVLKDNNASIAKISDLKLFFKDLYSQKKIN